MSRIGRSVLFMALLLMVSAACASNTTDSPTNTPQPTVPAPATPTSLPPAATPNPLQEPIATIAAAQATAQQIPGFEGVFTDEVNAHLYLFSGSVGQVVSIGMIEQGTQLDPYLLLMGPTGAVYAADDDGGDGGVAAAINDFELPVAGTYFVLATSARGRGEGPVIPEGATAPEPQAYRLTYEGVTAVESISLDDLDFSTLALERGTPTPIELTQDSPIRYILLEANAGETISIITEGEDFGADTLLYIFNDAGERIAVNDDVVETQSSYARIENFAFPRDGRYLVMVTVYNYFQAMNADWETSAPFTLVIE